MKVKPLLVTSLIVAGLLALFGVYAASLLPADARLPVHWNAAGEPDRFEPALSALLFAPALLVGISLLFAVVPRLEPLQDRLEGSAAALRTSWIAMIALLALLQFFTAAPAFGIDPPRQWVLMMVGALFLVIGNVLPKTRPGFFVGIRTPWTIIDTDTWIATHRLGAKCFIAAGAMMLLAGMIGVEGNAQVGVVIASVTLGAIVPAAYSWWHWQSKRGGEASQ